MEVIAQTQKIQISARKVRLIADMVRSMPLANALQTLHLTKKRAAVALEKTMRSALANAVNNAKLDANSLTIKRIEITDGVALKRYHPSTRGRIHPYKRRSSHIRVVLEEVQK